MKDNPYVGPRPYERRHQQNFYGRTREARDLLALIMAERVVVLYAPSGAGKTSLLNAKVIPALEAEEFVVLPPARVGSSPPPEISLEQVPNVFVYSVLLSLTGEQAAPADLTTHTLTSFLQHYYPEPAETEEGAPLLLIVDQFEELFTTHRARWQDAQDFFIQLSAALEAIPRLGILFAMREDFVAELDPYAPLLPRRLRARFRLTLLSPEGALEAIVKPAANRGISFAPAVGEQPGAAEWLRDELRRVNIQRQVGSEMITEVTLGPFVEPVQLQVVCHQLWANLPDQPDQVIDLQEVQRHGDVTRALGDFYERALQETTQQAGVAERALRRWFSEQLLTPMQTRGMALRGPEQTAGLPNAAVDVLQHKHIIRPELRAGARWYELAHDRLITPILRSNAAWEAARQTPLRVAARQWDKTKSPALLSRDEALRVALQWVAQHPDEVEPYEQAYLQASQEVDRRRRIIRRVQITAITIGALILVLVTFLAWSAARNGLRAYSKELAAKSQYWAQLDQDAALELAYEAIQQNDAPRLLTFWRPILGGIDYTEAEIALRQALTDFYPSYLYEDIADRQEVSSLVYGADGRHIYAGLSNGRIWAWEQATEQARYLPAMSAVRVLVNHPSLSIIAVGGDDSKNGLIRIFNTTTAAWEADLRAVTPDGMYEEIYALAYSPDGRYLAAAGDYGAKFRDADGLANAGMLRIWNVARQESFAVPTPHQTRVTGVAFSPDGRYLASSSTEGLLRLWELSDDGIMLTPHPFVTLTAHTGAVLDVKFSPTDPTLFASASADKTIRLWRIDLTNPAEPAKAVVTLIGHTREVKTLAFTANGDYLLSGSRDATALLWDVRALSPNAILRFTGHTNVVQGVAFDPAETTIATGDGSGNVRIWDRDFLRRERLSTLVGQNDRGRGLAYTPDGKYLVSGDNTGVGLIWDVATGDIARQLPPVGGKMWNLTVSHDSRYAVTCADDGNAYVWEIAAGAQVARLEGHTAGVEQAAFSPDDRYLVTGADDQRVLVWDTATWQQVAELTVPGLSKPGEIWGALEYSPDGRWIAAGYTGGRVQLWAVDTSGGAFQAEPAVYLPHAHTDHIMTADFSADSQYLATGGWDGVARIWRVEPLTLTLVGEPLEHTAYVYSVEFSPDDAYLATGARDQRIRLWDMTMLPDTPKIPAAMFVGHTDLIWAVSFSPDGSYVASNSWDRSIRRYLVNFEDVWELTQWYLEEEGE